MTNAATTTSQVQVTPAAAELQIKGMWSDDLDNGGVYYHVRLNLTADQVDALGRDSEQWKSLRIPRCNQYAPEMFAEMIGALAGVRSSDGTVFSAHIQDASDTTSEVWLALD
jgi:hypothetical protein